ncbi:MAG: cytochrome C [Azospira sp.]|jgi:cytochrome b subunit of formate dehydrogenase|nr:cytochrome C [Azospira sp.]
MHLKNLAALVMTAGAFALGAPSAAADETAGKAARLDDATCLSCHATDKRTIEVAGDDDEQRPLAHVDVARLGKGVHGRVQCVSCHTDIVDAKEKHEKAAGAEKPDCIACHERLWEDARKNGEDKAKPRLGVVVDNIAAYRDSFHARPDTDNPERPKATCQECHATHDFAVPAKGTPAHDQWRLEIPKTCGAQCHEDQLEDLESSVHGELLTKGDPKGATCSDCHTSHEVVGSSSNTFKLHNVEACGDCHQDELHSYRDTYHGQVHKLGFTYTARCSNCHGSHGIKAGDDPESKVHPDNRLKTCRSCHNGKKDGLPLATEGFTSFGPHANSHDFDKYPQMWITTKFMVGLLIGVFAFFWLHCILWYYREWQDRKKRTTETRIRTEEALGQYAGKHFVRFAWGWRVAHLCFALVTMTLVLTGTTVMFADSSWAPVVAEAFGGPKVLGFIHRIAATLFVGIFMIHFVYVMQKLLRDRNFRWFGPDSLIPNWKDLKDCRDMFKWFFGKGPRPQFDRWTYFEKFDYWAVFWGVNIIGWSGLMLAFPHITAQYLPGWVFNVATLVHGEEAFLAAVFLFTVHFFNNHFRPDKLPPPDVVMFTGTQSIEEFSHEHPAQYQRLVESGEIGKYLVDAPSRQMHVGSVILGLTLITAGLTLLVLVTMGFFKI